MLCFQELRLLAACECCSEYRRSFFCGAEQLRRASSELALVRVVFLCERSARVRLGVQLLRKQALRLAAALVEKLPVVRGVARASWDALCTRWVRSVQAACLFGELLANRERFPVIL